MRDVSFLRNLILEMSITNERPTLENESQRSQF